jgi:hypothetical protein
MTPDAAMYSSASMLVRCSTCADHTSFVMCVLSSAALRWSRVATEGTPPGARDGHSACVVGKNMYIFGGYVALVSCVNYLCLDEARVISFFVG